MSWLKDVIVDITATLVIIAAVLFPNVIINGIVWGYTGLMLLVKLIVIWGDGFRNLMKKSKTTAPQWFSHLLYAINTGILLGFQWWYAGAGWALIWLLSYLTQKKLDEQSA
jgi:hypothetical protein